MYASKAQLVKSSIAVSCLTGLRLFYCTKRGRPAATRRPADRRKLFVAVKAYSAIEENQSQQQNPGANRKEKRANGYNAENQHNEPEIFTVAVNTVFWLFRLFAFIPVHRTLLYLLTPVKQFPDPLYF